MRQSTRNIALATLAAAAALVCQPAAAQSAEAARAAVRKALQTNPEVTAKLNAYMAKGDALDAAKAGWMPRVDLNADVGADRAKYKNNTTQDSTLKRAGVGLSVSQVLWDGLATRNEVNRASHDRMGRWFDFIEATEQTALDSTRAVYDVQRQRKLLALAEDNLLQHKQAVTKIESRVTAGVGRGVDLDQARARLALAESNLETELANLHDVAARFQRIVGETPPADMGALELLKQGMPGGAGDAVATAIAKSPAIAASIANLRAARASEDTRRSALQPRVEARARAGGGVNYGGVDARKGDAAVELVLNWNLFDGGADQARIREQHNNVGQAMDLRDKACRDVRQTAAIAYNDASKLMGQVNTLARNSAAIERARDAYRQQFDIGQRSLLDLLNAENEAYTARRALTNAVFDRAVAHARTLAAMSQLNVQLDIARDLLPKGGDGWDAASDGPGRCPAQPVDVATLRAGLEPGSGATALAGVTMPGQATPAAPAVPGATFAAVVPNVAPLVDAWAAAWRKKDLSGLAAMYAPDFAGDEASPKAWMAKQQAQLAGKKPVQLEVDKVTTATLGDGQVETRFRQVQGAGSSRTVQDKVLVWKQLAGQWRIARETTL